MAHIKSSKLKKKSKLENLEAQIRWVELFLSEEGLQEKFEDFVAKKYQETVEKQLKGNVKPLKKV